MLMTNVLCRTAISCFGGIVMQLINSQYRIMEILQEDKYGVKYLAEDLHKDNAVRRIRLIEKTPETEDFIEYMKVNFFDYTNIIHPNIYKFYYFNKISAIDARPVVSNKYYFTYEDIEGQNLFDYVKGKDTEELLDISVQLLSAFKYLHLRGFIFCSINPEDLYIVFDEGKSQLKIASLPYSLHADYSVVINKESSYFKAPESLQYGIYDRSTDIYLLGIMLYHIFTGEDIGVSHFGLSASKNVINNQLSQIFRIIEKCTATRIYMRYNSIDEIIDDINGIFNKNYTIIDKKYIETLPVNPTKLVAREDTLKRLIDNSQGYLYGNKKKKLSAIIGDYGTGKGALLEAFMIRLGLEGEHAAYAVLNEDDKEDYYAIKVIIKSILKYAEKELIDKYFEQLSVLIPELVKTRNVNPLADKTGGEDKTIYRLGNFILETSLFSPFIIIIKNFEYLDVKSRKILNYVLMMQGKSKVPFVVTFHDDISQKEAKESLNLNLKDFELDIVKLSKYNIYETAEAIRILLAMDCPPVEFAAKVYKETEGNPCLVHETIYALFLDKHIHTDNKGNWVFKDVDFSKIHLSIDIIEILQNKIKKLETNKKHILDIISIFDDAVPTDILASMCKTGLIELTPLLENLVSLNILTRKLDEWGISYYYTSVGLKKAVYGAIKHDIRTGYHEKASRILEEKFKIKRENKNELIFQMAKGGRAKDAIEYLITISDEMIEKNLYKQAIRYLKSSLRLFDEKSTSKKRVEISIKLGDLLYKTGEYEKCLRYYKIAEEFVFVSEEKYLLTDIYIKKIYAYYRLNNIKKCLEYSRLAKKQIREIQYREGMLNLVLALSDLLIYRRKTNSIIKIMEKILKSLNEEDHYYYGMFMSIYGKALLKKSRHEEAMVVLKISAKILEELEEYEGLVVALNAMGVIYIDFYNEYKKAREYFEKTLAISQEINNINHMMLSYINIAEVNKNEELFGKSLNYIKKALDLVEYYPNIYTKSILYNNAAMTNLEMENYDKYIEYMVKGKPVIFENKDTGEVINHYYSNEAVFYYSMGMFKEAYENVKKSIEISKAWGIVIEPNVALVNVLSKIKLGGEMNYPELKESCLSLLNSKNYKVGRLACNKIAELYLDKNDKDEAKSFLELSAKYKEYVNTPILDIVYRYLYIVASEDIDKAGPLTSLAEEYDYLDNNEIKWKIYKAIGTDLADSGDTFGGLKNLITSFNHLRLLMENVPKEYKIQFLKSHNRITIKEKLVAVAQKITGQADIVQSVVSLSDRNDDIEHEISEYFDYKKFKDLIIKYENAISKRNVDLNESMLGKFLLGLFDRINGFGIDIEDNIKKMMEAFMGFTQAKNGFLAITDENNEIKMLYSNIKDENMGFYKYIIEKVKQGEESIIIPDVFEYKKKAYGSLIPKDISAVFCIPIVSSDAADNLKMERRKGGGAKNINGYLYLDTDTIINNFSDETGHLCKKVSKIAYILIDNYNLKMVNAFDKLTKLYTRKYFENALSNAIAKGGVFSVIMADIDRFKAVNDKYGHQVGDEVLAKLSDIILKKLRKTDICGRYGGEEFVMLLPDTDTQGALQLAEKIRKKIENASLFSHHSPITISMGIATYPIHSTWSKDLIDKADQAMYSSKEAGRNKTKIYDENLVKSDRRVNKLAGIVEGNVEEDINRVENIIEVLEIERNPESSKNDKMFEFLGKAIKMSGAQIGSIFFINEHNEPIRQITRRGTIPATIKNMDYNKNLLERCIQSKAGEYLIDWSKNAAVDAVTGMPDWQSVVIIPITNAGKVNAVLYLSVSLKEKEFEADTYNYINTLCKIIAPIFLL